MRPSQGGVWGAWDTVTSFTGHVETAGLVEFATRTYDPASRVWVQEDSYTGTVARASSLNRYAYVEGSPASHTDVLGAYRAASAMAAQQLSAVDYAAFIVRLRIFSAIGVHNEQVERARKLAAIDAQFEEDQRQIAEDGKFFSVSNMRDMSSVGLHGLVNFGGGFVNGASGLVNGLTGAVNWGNNTCASVHLCVDIPDIAAIPAIPIWGDYDTYKYSSWIGSGTFQAVAVVGSGGIGAGGLSADAGTAALNASGFNLARTGVSKITSLFNMGKTGTETVTTIVAESTGVAARADNLAEVVTAKPMLQIEAPPVRLQIEAPPAAKSALDVSRLMGEPGDIVVIGRIPDTKVAAEWPGHVVLNDPGWDMVMNDAFIARTIEEGRTAYLASPIEGNLIQTSGELAGEPTVLARELQQLADAGYTRAGDYLVPPA